MTDFKKLLIWQRSHQLDLKIYSLTSTFPNAEKFGLSSQMQRAAVSIPSNIAEGCGRISDGDLARSVTISMGSASELEYQILLAKDLLYLSESDFMEISEELKEVRKMINSFLQKVNSRR